MNKYISPSMKVRSLHAEQLLTVMSLHVDDPEVGDDDPIFAPHKNDDEVLKTHRSVWDSAEEE